MDPNAASPYDVFSSPNDTTPITTADQNPSNGIDLNALMSNLIGGASSAFAARQNSQAAQSIAQAQIAAAQSAPANPLAIFTTSPNAKFYLMIGAGIILFAIVMRK